MALVIQAVQIALLWTDPTVQGPIIDGREYHLEAARIAANLPPPGEPHYQSPLFPWALSVVYRVLDSRPENGLLLQALLTVACAILVLAIGRRLLSPTAALVSGLLAALYGPMLFFASQLIPAPIDAVTLLAVALGAIVIRGSSRVTAHLLLGLACGLAMAARGTVAPAVVWLALRPWRYFPIRGALARTTSLVAGTFAGMLPVAISNLSRTGSFSLTTSNLGVNLWLGNNPDIAASTAIRPGWQWDHLLSEPARHGVIPPMEASDWLRDRAFDWMLSDPMGWLHSMAIKTLDVLNGLEIPRNLDPYGELSRTPITVGLLWDHGIRFPFGLILPLAAIGFTAHWGGTDDRARSGKTLLIFVLLNVVGIALFFPCGRYRLGMALAMIPLAVSGMMALARMARRFEPPSWPALALGGLLALSANLLPNFTGPDLREEAPIQEAMAYESAGRVKDAARVLEEIVPRRPNDADAWRFLGQIRAAQGDPDGAIVALRRAVSLAPEFAHAWHHLGSLLMVTGNPTEAVQALEKAVAAHPGHPLAWADLAMARAKLQTFDAARDAAKRAIEINPDNPKGWVVMGYLDLVRGAPASAEEHLKQAIRLDPTDPQPRFLFALSLANQGHESKARDLLTAMLREWPDHEDARRLLRHLQGIRD